MSLAELADVLSGRLHQVPDATVRVTGPVSEDSRNIEPGGLHAAIVGARVDGHDYAAQAVAAGAVAVLAQRPVDAPAVIVDDVQDALGRLTLHLITTRAGQAPLVGITGSAGKTTTKDLTARVLSMVGSTVVTPGSRNSEVGLPTTVANADLHGAEHLVLEMGARGIGHIAYLTTIAPPRVGAVLNVGSAHSGEFGGVEAIAQAKGELVEALPAADAGGVAVLNADDARVAAMAGRTKARVLTFG